MKILKIKLVGIVLPMCYVCAMDEKQERSYAKESTKSTPTGIRFDLDKLAFIQKRENVPTRQKVVDFLLNKYWWENKVPHVTAKESPPIGLIKEPQTTRGIDDIVSVPKDVTPVIKTPQQYIAEMEDFMSDFEYREQAKRIEADEYLTKKEKQDLLLRQKLPKN